MKEQVIELAKQAGIDSMPPDMNYRSPYYACTPDELEVFAGLVRNAALTEAIDKARIFGLGLPIAETERLIKALESLKEPTP